MIANHDAPRSTHQPTNKPPTAGSMVRSRIAQRQREQEAQLARVNEGIRRFNELGSLLSDPSRPQGVLRQFSSSEWHRQMEEWEGEMAEAIHLMMEGLPTTTTHVSGRLCGWLEDGLGAVSGGGFRRMAPIDHGTRIVSFRS